MEFEFVALAAAGNEAEWLRNLVYEIPLWPKLIFTISIRCDSAATLAKAYSQVYSDCVVKCDVLWWGGVSQRDEGGVTVCNGLGVGLGVGLYYECAGDVVNFRTWLEKLQNAMRIFCSSYVLLLLQLYVMSKEEQFKGKISRTNDDSEDGPCLMFNSVEGFVPQANSEGVIRGSVREVVANGVMVDGGRVSVAEVVSNGGMVDYREAANIIRFWEQMQLEDVEKGTRALLMMREMEAKICEKVRFILNLEGVVVD
nr:zinc finger, CCHC-type [Tanacetum cinerariifolium]